MLIRYQHNHPIQQDLVLQAGIGYDRSYRCAHSSRGIWHASHGDVMQQVLTNKRLKGMGLISLVR